KKKSPTREETRRSHPIPTLPPLPLPPLQRWRRRRRRPLDPSAAAVAHGYAERHPGSNTVHCQGSSILIKDMEYTLYTTSSSVLHISLLEEVLGWRFSLYGDFLVISFVNCT
ncbi:Os06g0116100, partial [Oryza sativa Japonica Group]